MGDPCYSLPSSETKKGKEKKDKKKDCECYNCKKRGHMAKIVGQKEEEWREKGQKEGRDQIGKKQIRLKKSIQV